MFFFFLVKVVFWGCDGSENIEWQGLLGEAATTEEAGIREVAAVAQATRRD